MWRRHRDRISGLLLANTRPDPDPPEAVERRRAVAEAARTQGSGAIADSPPQLLSEDADESLWDLVKDTIRRQPGEAIAAAALGMARRPDSRPLLPEIDVPTTVLTSTGDTLIPPDLSRPMADAIPGAELVVLEGAGHLSNLEDPEGFLAAIRALLDRTS
jgi:pimeloyl-ACP methyl ester carboxylesterase